VVDLIVAVHGAQINGCPKAVCVIPASSENPMFAECSLRNLRKLHYSASLAVCWHNGCTYAFCFTAV